MVGKYLAGLLSSRRLRYLHFSMRVCVEMSTGPLWRSVQDPCRLSRLYDVENSPRIPIYAGEWISSRTRRSMMLSCMLMIVSICLHTFRYIFILLYPGNYYEGNISTEPWIPFWGDSSSHIIHLAPNASDLHQLPLHIDQEEVSLNQATDDSRRKSLEALFTPSPATRR